MDTRDLVIPVSPACSVWPAAVGRTLREFVRVLTLAGVVLAAAELSEAVILDGGDLLVVDPDCCVDGGIIRVNPVDGSQTPVFIDNHFVSPRGIAIAANGDLLVVDPKCCGPGGGIIRVNPVDGSQTPVSSGNHFVSPVGIAIAANGDLLVADPGCCNNSGGVIRVDPINGGQTIVSSGNNFSGPRGGPVGIAIVPPSPQLPRPCGGDVPCACGDRVVRDHTLRGVDPVTRARCSVNGLLVADGVTLDLGGATLRGLGAGAGILIDPGARRVTVRGGKLMGFATGVLGEETTGGQLENLQILDNTGDGIRLGGADHTVTKVVIQRNAGGGLMVTGDATEVSNVQVTSNGGDGVRLRGSGATLEASVIARNEGAGVDVTGNGNRVSLLQLDSNGGDGLRLAGTGNLASRNIAQRNGGHGLEIQGASATLDRNRAPNNGGFGITDDSTGGGTSGTANTYVSNTCGRGNDAGISSPPGLCR